MSFELKKDYIKFGKIGKTSNVFLPAGNCSILLNTLSKVKNYPCVFTGENPTVLVDAGFFGGYNICGDILITLHH